MWRNFPPLLASRDLTLNPFYIWHFRWVGNFVFFLLIIATATATATATAIVTATATATTATAPAT